MNTGQVHKLKILLSQIELLLLLFFNLNSTHHRHSPTPSVGDSNFVKVERLIASLLTIERFFFYNGKTLL